jgi:hypothetical protein
VYATPAPYSPPEAKLKPNPMPKPKQGPGSIVLEPSTSPDSHTYNQVAVEVERLVDHARSAIRFRDLKTTTEKLSEALRMIWRFQDEEEEEDDDDDSDEY